jgi:hypothetical protein
VARNPGKLVEFKTKDNIMQKAIAYDAEQDPAFKKVNKVFIRYVDNAFQFQRDGTGKKIVGLKAATELKLIGFID